MRHTLPFPVLALTWSALPLTLMTVACSDDPEGGTSPGTGGSSASGGSGAGSGGRASGGASTGGRASGGGASSGGTPSSGGAANGGSAGSGGAAPDGGVEAGPDGAASECGNGEVEPGENCDETSATCASCRFVPMAFRMTELVLHDPVPQIEDQGACTNLLGAINGLISSNFNGDAPAGDAGGDGEIDLSFVMVHRPLQQAGTGNATFYQAACSAPTAGTTCTPKAALPGLPYTVTNQAAGTCLEPAPSTVTPGSGPITPATAGANGCMLSSSATFALALGPVDLTFDSARIAAQWVGSPASGMVEGIFVGFLSQERVNQITLPPELGSFALATAFPTGAAAVACTDEIDVGPDGTTPGWWWHLNFTAEAVGWSD